MILTQFAGLASGAERFELKDKDRVVLLGATFIEREGQFGYIETALTMAWPDRKVMFRNLGWSGDTVWADSRGIFDPPQVGYQRMMDLVKELKPTVILLGYGQNESYAGDAGLEPFIRQYEKLCDDLQPTGARLVFLTPTRLEKPAPPLPDASRQNAMLARYVEAIRQLAARRQAPIIDLFAIPPAAKNLTENGMHFGPGGYAAVAQAIRSQQKLPTRGFTSAQEEQIRHLIVEKNRLFFYRWRPQNITYLTGFRKHEQGNNAVEIAQFDPLVEQIELRIDELKKQ
ncbi:MAG: SGNH/GDSL hydrolase family protein [Planctomycetes bacterium]|nr:SGNH/GDSL hydrolase family protein [Planctomycetota bacterium]